MAENPPEPELITIFEAGSRFEAEMIVARLTEAGIKSAYFADDGGGTHPELITTEPIRIKVQAPDSAAARDIIGSLEGDTEA